MSFLSTSRIEQIAAKNLTRQNAASALAERATQQAMANIAFGFNTTGGNLTGNYTSVVTTQPGAIHKYFFLNGTVAQNTTVELFSSGNLTVNTTSTALAGNSCNETANMNNLSNPTGNATGHLTLTGNSSEEIHVRMEEVNDAKGNLVGRIAYYVDDELTKININSATDNRSTLNVADSRTLSLSTLISDPSILGKFRNTTEGKYNGTSDIKSWSYYFRPEQAIADGNATSGGLNLSPTSDLPFLTALPPSDFHMKYTPWGARRLFINDTDAAEVPLDSAGVEKIVAALSDQHLRNIYGQTFADKYNTIDGAAIGAPVGLKQIAANMLQRKLSSTSHHNKSYAYTGPLIGGDNRDSDGIPKEYLGQASFPSINEIGISARLAVECTGGNISIRNILQVCIEIIGWETGGNPTTSNKTGQIIVDLDSLTYDVNYSTTENGTTTDHTLSLGGTWPLSGSSGPFTQFSTNATRCTQNFGWEDPNDWRINNPPENPGYWSIHASIERDSRRTNLSCLDNGKTYRYHIGTLGRAGRVGEISMGFSYPESSNIRINSITNMRASIKKVLLLANSNDPSTIRDWVVASRDIGHFSISLSTANLTGFSFPFTASHSTSIRPEWADPEPVAAPAWSYGRVDPRLKSVSLLGNSSNPWRAYSNNSTYPGHSNNATFAWGPYGNSTWGSDQDLNKRQGYGFLGYFYHTHHEGAETGKMHLFTKNSSWTRDNLIPGDPLPRTAKTEALNFHFFQVRGAWFLNDNGVLRWPYFYKGIANVGANSGWDSGFVFPDASGNRVFIAPSDLGTVATNYPWRTLRMQVQPRNEISSTDGGGNMTAKSLIPDWAMLDVISFGMNSTTIPMNFSSHVNLNNKFVTPNGTRISNRSQSLESLLKSMDDVSASESVIFRNPYGLSGNSLITSNSVTGNYARLPSPATICYDELGNANKAAGLPKSTTWSQLIASHIGNMTWSPSSFWGANNTAKTSVRKSKGFPTNQFVLPSEVAEIRDIADLVSTNSTTFLSSTRYANVARYIKSNELRLAPFFPGATTCSNFFTIYAYAQAGQLQDKNQPESAGNSFIIDSEALTKTLVEVEITVPATATTPAKYKVKKLYTQPIPLGQ